MWCGFLPTFVQCTADWWSDMLLSWTPYAFVDEALSLSVSVSLHCARSLWFYCHLQAPAEAGSGEGRKGWVSSGPCSIHKAGPLCHFTLWDKISAGYTLVPPAPWHWLMKGVGGAPRSCMHIGGYALFVIFFLYILHSPQRKIHSRPRIRGLYIYHSSNCVDFGANLF